LPSQVGFFPVEYDKVFLSLSGSEQYVQLLWKNGLVVLKAILHVDLARTVSLPNPSVSGLGGLAIALIALLDFAAVSCLVLGVLRIRNNLKTWNASNRRP
jgi:hypothetical protein